MVWNTCWISIEMQFKANMWKEKLILDQGHPSMTNKVLSTGNAEAMRNHITVS